MFVLYSCLFTRLGIAWALVLLHGFTDPRYLPQASLAVYYVHD